MVGVKALLQNLPFEESDLVAFPKVSWMTEKDGGEELVC